MLMPALLACSCGSFSPADAVNTLQGTMSIPSFSTGNTYPAVAVPRGMNFWTPQTRNNGNGWQYVYSDELICGFKQTHQPSPWINDYGCFSLMPVSGDLVIWDNDRATGFTHLVEKAHPYYYGVDLDSGVKAEMVPTNSGAVMKFTYPNDRDAFIVIDCFSDSGEISWSGDAVKGFSKWYSSNNSSELPEDFASHFYMTLDAPVSDWGVIEQDGKKCAWLKIDTDRSNVVELKVASSFISGAQAETNYSRELGTETFSSVKKSARAIWNRELGKFAVKGGTDEQVRTFYSTLYRTMLFPRRLHETDESGETVHFDFYNGGVRKGFMYGDNGFWDTFRSVHPLLTIISPSVSGEFMQALQNIFMEGGWLPEWFSPAYKDCMVGQHSVSVVTDAFIKGIDCFDTGLMLEAFLKGAHAEGPKATGRKGAADYDNLGYVPYDNGVTESVSRTLEYAYNDYCISLYAGKLGYADLAEKYAARALNYRNVIDPETGFVRPKGIDGHWDEDWTPDTWGGAFTEGSAWHWTWCVYHDAKGLMESMGGEDAFIARMDEVFTTPPTFRSSYYKHEIHEMTEMVAGDMGQYAHGNQPIQHMIYLYDYAGVPYKAQYHVREVMDRLYSSGTEDGRGFCGDEDNGQTSAWYVFSAMGFYPVCPGSSEYAFGSPLFSEMSVKLENGKTFRVKAVGNSGTNVYIHKAKLNGKEINRSYITHDEIMNGGVLEFEMSDSPNISWASSPESRPHSLTD